MPNPPSAGRNRSSAISVVILIVSSSQPNRPFQAILNEELPERLVPADWLKKWTHEEIDAGADIIVMHGVPLVHGVEIYHKRPIFYDLGNFIFNVPPGGYTTRR